MSPEAALADLRRIPGIGPTYADLILLRSTGATDMLTLAEPHLPTYVAHFYGLPHPATAGELEGIADAWRPFRTWTSVLIRVAGDRAQIGGGRERPPPLQQAGERRDADQDFGQEQEQGLHGVVATG